MTNQDFREIATHLEFKEVNEFQNVINYSDEPETYYMLLNGIVSLRIKNPQIKKWDFAWKEYQKLKKWKKEKFDPRVEKASAEDSY